MSDAFAIKQLTSGNAKSSRPSYAEPKVSGSAQKQKENPSNPSTGADFVELGRSRRASVSEFKGRKLLNIREYYEKDGEVLPPFFLSMLSTCLPFLAV